MSDRFVILMVVSLLFISSLQGGDAMWARRRRSTGYRSPDQNTLIRGRRDQQDKMCDPGYASLDNGEVTCSDGNKALSICFFTCNDGYEMINLDATVMFCDGTKWSGTKPTCETKKTEA